MSFVFAGISDWKCEECNKLFPSKGALQRHNNIHTGKLNYQVRLTRQVRLRDPLHD